MRHEIINRAQNNRLLEQNTSLTQVQKKGIQINYILNRITEQYFADFKEELKPFARHQKIIQKILQQHNFINIYCQLIKSLKNQIVEVEGEKCIWFKCIFIQRLQQNFYKVVRKGQWQGKQQLYKKQLIGMSLFVGQMFNLHLLSKNIFPDLFYQLVHNYVLQYHLFSDNKNLYYFQTYIECAIKMIEKMGKNYDDLLKRKNTNNLQQVLVDLLNTNNPEDYNFKHICDYIQILKQINIKLPSQRCKISFLLEDFRCSKSLRKDNLSNEQYQVVKSILNVDLNQPLDVKRLPDMVARTNPDTMMKDYFFQFAEGNLKQVNKHLQIYKLIANCPNVCNATIKALKDNTEELFMIESDFPFLSQGIAKILKTVCQIKRIDFRELELGQEDYPDEDVRDFLQNIQGKYFKLIMQD